MKALSLCESCKKLNTTTKEVLMDYVQATRDLDGILELAPKLEQLAQSKTKAASFIRLLLYKIPRKELSQHIDLLLDPNLEPILSPIIKQYEKEAWDYSDDFIDRYISFEDIGDPKKI